MKRTNIILVGFALLAMLSFAQEQKSRNVVPAYSQAQEQTFSGIVQEAKEYQCPVSGTIGSHVSVKEGSEVIEVHLAPAKFLRQYEMVLRPGDKVTITGMKFVFEGNPAMLARTVVDGQYTFTFRNRKGRPEW